jgi:hypothetical protein
MGSKAGNIAKLVGSSLAILIAVAVVYQGIQGRRVP